jgi:hypothetical protein
MGDLASRVRNRALELAAAGEDDLGASSLRFRALSARKIDAAQRALGLTLPESLREMYTDVGNGGFGPDYGLIGLVGGARNEDGNDVVGQYRMYQTPDPDDAEWSWPSGLLPVVNLGCAMYYCVDATSPEGKVIWFEPALIEPGTSPARAFIPLGRTFASLMEGWVAGEATMDVLAAAQSPA